MTLCVDKKLVYRDLGTPIIFEENSIKDKNKIYKKVLLSLCWRPFPLLGQEVFFIRRYFKLTIAEFAKKLGLKAFSVLNWEKRKDNIAKVPFSVDLRMRLFVIKGLGYDEKVFKSDFRIIDLEKKSYYKDKKCHLISFFQISEDKKNHPLTMWVIWILQAHKMMCITRHVKKLVA